MLASGTVEDIFPPPAARPLSLANVLYGWACKVSTSWVIVSDSKKQRKGKEQVWLHKRTKVAFPGAALFYPLLRDRFDIACLGLSVPFGEKKGVSVLFEAVCAGQTGSQGFCQSIAHAKFIKYIT